MSYNVDNIIPVNLSLTPIGLRPANFTSLLFFAVDGDLQSSGSISVDTYKDYASLEEVGQDFSEDSPPYLAATRWFAQIPTPETFTIWLWDDTSDSVSTVLGKAYDEIWRYFFRFPNSITSTESDVTDAADFADTQGVYTAVILSSSAVVDPQDSSDIASSLKDKGNRHISVGYRKSATITDDASQEYADVQLMAAFEKFDPDGVRTAITGEYQVLPGVVGESLTTTEYGALKDKNVIFWTEVELQGSTDASRTINTKSMSSYGEFMDDVVNTDVLRNYLQVNGYNYFANAGDKRPYTPTGYAGLLDRIQETLQQFYTNGVLGRATYTDPRTGEEKTAKYGYALFSEPADVLDATSSQRSSREYPPVDGLAILARAGHTCQLNITVE
jgi:hypothetical protein